MSKTRLQRSTRQRTGTRGESPRWEAGAEAPRPELFGGFSVGNHKQCIGLMESMTHSLTGRVEGRGETSWTARADGEGPESESRLAREA